MSAAVQAIGQCSQCGEADACAGDERCAACDAEEKHYIRMGDAVDNVLAELRAANVPGLAPILATVAANWADVSTPIRVLEVAAGALAGEIAAAASIMQATPQSDVVQMARRLAWRCEILGRVTAALELATMEYGS